MDGGKRAGILDPQSRQCIDVEEASVIDVAGRQPPMAEPVVLAFEQMVQRQRLRGAIRPGAIGGQATLDDRRCSVDCLELCLERWGFLAVGMAEALVA